MTLVEEWMGFVGKEGSREDRLQGDDGSMIWPQGYDSMFRCQQLELSRAKGVQEV